MCLIDSIEKLSEVVEAAANAKSKLDRFEAMARPELEFDCTSAAFSVGLSADEVRLILTRRVEAAAAALNELVRPVVKVEPGDRAREIESMNSRKGLQSQEGGV